MPDIITNSNNLIKMCIANSKTECEWDYLKINRNQAGMTKKCWTNKGAEVLLDVKYFKIGRRMVAINREAVVSLCCCDNGDIFLM